MPTPLQTENLIKAACRFAEKSERLLAHEAEITRLLRDGATAARNGDRIEAQRLKSAADLKSVQVIDFTGVHRDLVRYSRPFRRLKRYGNADQTEQILWEKPAFKWEGNLKDDCRCSTEELMAHCENLGGESSPESSIWFVAVYRGDTVLFHSGEADGNIIGGEMARAIAESILAAALASR